MNSRDRSRRYLLLALLALTAGCAASLPVSATPSLNGIWIVTVAEADGTEVDARMTFANDGPHVEAWSRPGAVRELINWRIAIAGYLLGKLPPHRAVLTFDGQISPDASRLMGVLSSPFLRAYTVNAIVRDGAMDGTLQPVNAPRAPAGRFTARRAIGNSPLRDYPALADRVMQVADSVVYDPAITRTKSWQTFRYDFRGRMARARDDLDAVVAFQAAQPLLGTSHWGFIRNPTVASTPFEKFVEGNVAILPDTLVTLSFPAAGLAVLRVSKWERVTQAVNRAFTRIDSARSNVLVLDIRSNGGGDATSGIPAAHLVSDSVTLGTFLGPKWYGENRGSPDARDRSHFPVLTSDSNGVDIIRYARSVGGVSTLITPLSPHFSGEVILLIDGGTASASEPLAHLLHVTHRATLIGQRTAGKMLTALPHDVGEGWILLAPEADFIAADGTRLEGRGVTPDIVTERGGEYIAVGEKLSAANPFASLLLRGAGLLALRRYGDAQQAYERLAELAPDSTAGVGGLINVAIARGDFNRAFGLANARIALKPHEMAALNLKARAALASRMQLEATRDELHTAIGQGLPVSLASRILTHRNLGFLLRALGDTAAAAAELEEVLRLDPVDREALAARAQMR